KYFWLASSALSILLLHKSQTAVTSTFFFAFERRYNAVELSAAIPDTDVPQRNPVICSINARISQRKAAPCCASGRHHSTLLHDFSSIDHTFYPVSWLLLLAEA